MVTKVSQEQLIEQIFEGIDLEERREVAKRIVVGFPPETESNYMDSHSRLDPFGTLWGRGVVFKGNEGFEARVGGYQTSHAQLRQSAKGRDVVKTFYFGFEDNVLYLEDGSIGKNVDFNRDMVIEIAASISEEGPLRGIAYRFG